MSFFTLFREEGFPTQFQENKTAASADVLVAGLILAFCIIAASFLLVLPGLRKETRLNTLVWIIISLFVGGVLLTCNFGQEWETAHITTPTPYKAGQAHEINAAIGLKIGLRSVNITLVEINKNTSDEANPLRDEIINYNEMFVWTWDQGRFGFGPNAGHLQQDFRKAQLRGLPLPILWVADYFTIDGEGLRFGRFYRTAGWYTHIVMWTAFPCWLLANIFFLTVIRYGAVLTILTGLLQLLACILWASIRNPNPLIIPFDDKTLETEYGCNFWLTLATGILCIILGTWIWVLDRYFPEGRVSKFFGIDPYADYEELHLTAAEAELLRDKDKLRDYSISNDENDSVNGEPNTHIVYARRFSHSTPKHMRKEAARMPTIKQNESICLTVPPTSNVFAKVHGSYKSVVSQEALERLNAPLVPLKLPTQRPLVPKRPDKLVTSQMQGKGHGYNQSRNMTAPEK